MACQRGSESLLLLQWYMEPSASAADSVPASLSVWLCSLRFTVTGGDLELFDAVCLMSVSLVAAEGGKLSLPASLPTASLRRCFPAYEAV